MVDPEAYLREVLTRIADHPMKMRCIVMVRTTKDSESGVMPKQELLAEMGKFNEELVKAGVLLAAEGLQPSSKGKRVCFSGATRTVIDSPFTETKAGKIDARSGRMGQALPKSV